jgi:copper chaperone CopZ
MTQPVFEQSGQVPSQRRSFQFTVPDMMCGSCGKKIMTAVQGLDGLAVVTADPETKLVTIVTVWNEMAMRVAIEGIGFEVV